jgi:hypothetical protein
MLILCFLVELGEQGVGLVDAVLKEEVVDEGDPRAGGSGLSEETRKQKCEVCFFELFVTDGRFVFVEESVGPARVVGEILECLQTGETGLWTDVEVGKDGLVLLHGLQI